MATEGRDQRVLDYLRRFDQDYGYSPSLRQIGAGSKIASTNTVTLALNSLEQRGFLARQPGQPRSIVLTSKALATIKFARPKGWPTERTFWEQKVPLQCTLKTAYELYRLVDDALQSTSAMSKEVRDSGEALLKIMEQAFVTRYKLSPPPKGWRTR